MNPARRSHDAGHTDWKFVRATFQARFGGIVRLHISKHFRIFHKLLQV
jgi:hypothetical protein